MARTVSKSLVAGAMAALLLAVAAVPADAGAPRTRPGGSKASSSSGSSGGGGKARASGRASYGHGRHHYRGHYGYGHYGYHGHWGYPYYALGFWPYGYWGTWHPRAYPVRIPGGVYENARAVLETDVRPRKAEVRVDEHFVGQARDFNGRWDRLWLEPGQHMIEFRADGYMTLRRYVDLDPAGYLQITDRLQKGEGLDPRSTEKPPSRAPASAKQRPPRPPVPGTESLKRGLLRLEVRPGDAAVYLDGSFLARGDELARLHGALPVARGVHTVEVVRPGYTAQSREVEISEDRPVRLVIELEPRE